MNTCLLDIEQIISIFLSEQLLHFQNHLHLKSRKLHGAPIDYGNELAKPGLLNLVSIYKQFTKITIFISNWSGVTFAIFLDPKLSMHSCLILRVKNVALECFFVQTHTEQKIPSSFYWTPEANKAVENGNSYKALLWLCTKQKVVDGYEDFFSDAFRSLKTLCSPLPGVKLCWVCKTFQVTDHDLFIHFQVKRFTSAFCHNPIVEPYKLRTFPSTLTLYWLSSFIELDIGL